MKLFFSFNLIRYLFQPLLNIEDYRMADTCQHVDNQMITYNLLKSIVGKNHTKLFVILLHYRHNKIWR